MDNAIRRVHLDFHTSEYLEVGNKFSKEDFQNALKIGNVQSITVFAKCHHSWCYYPSKVGKMHPHLKFDLLKEMVDAAQEIGVTAPVYITLGWSENDAIDHPEWRSRKFGTREFSDLRLDDERPDSPRQECAWKNLCLNGSYQEHYFAITEEICKKFDKLDGLFYDIVNMDGVCVCDDCVKGMKQRGLDPDNFADARKYYIDKRCEMMRAMNELKDKYHPNATIFFNGTASQETAEYLPYQSHYELEDLPTTWGGYNKMILRAKYFNETNKFYLGMTGKFHTNWGEFGGYKDKDALKYECAAMLAYGAGCSIGDQMHPSGKMDEDTYKLIGYAYDYVKKIEPFCFNVQSATNLGLVLSGNNEADEMASVMLASNQLDFDVVIDIENCNKEVLIFSENAELNQQNLNGLEKFLNCGGKIVVAGNVHESLRPLLKKYGLEFIGSAGYDMDYVEFSEKINEDMIKSPLLCYNAGYATKADDSFSVVAYLREPYFSRTVKKFCSHFNTPFKETRANYNAAVIGKNILYFAHNIFYLYHEYGSVHYQKYFYKALRLFYLPNLEVAGLMTAGRSRLTEQSEFNRYILHLMYGQPVKRGKLSLLDDFPIINEVSVKIKTDKIINRVYLPVENKDIEFTLQGGELHFTVCSIKVHKLLVIEY